jgi:CheY-like chemotaxis protein
LYERSKRVVLVIDGDEEQRVTHETILRAEGYATLGAPSGARALPLLREQPPGLVLMASKIGPLTPVQLTRVIAGDSTLGDVKILVYGADGDGVVEGEVVKAGAHRYLVLPVSPQQLVREVVVLIGRP